MYLLGGTYIMAFLMAALVVSRESLLLRGSPLICQRQSAAGVRSHTPLMMPIGIPRVAYRMPGASTGEWVNIYDRLYRERIMFLGQEVDDRIVNQLIAVMLFSDAEDPEKPLYLYVNSPGGSVVSGLALYDAMQHISAPVATVNIGMAASMVLVARLRGCIFPVPFLSPPHRTTSSKTHTCLSNQYASHYSPFIQGSFILGAGQRGMRLSLPHSRVMVHQPMGSAGGQAEDIRIQAEEILKIKDSLVTMYAQMTGQTRERVIKALDRDTWMSPREAMEFGLVDRIVTSLEG